MPTIGRHHRGSTRNAYPVMCAYCSVPWPRHQLARDGAGKFVCPDCNTGRDATTLARLNAATPPFRGPAPADAPVYHVRVLPPPISWRALQTAATRAWFVTAYSEPLGLFVRGGDPIDRTNSVYSRSPTGEAPWTETFVHVSNMSGPSCAIWAPVNGVFVFLGAGNTLSSAKCLTSPDGVVFTPHAIGTGSVNTGWYSIIELASGTLLAGGPGRTAGEERFARSINAGATWAVSATPTASRDWGLYGATNGTVALFSDGGSNQLARSEDDGLTWSLVSLPDATGFVYGDLKWCEEINKFVAIGFSDADYTEQVAWYSSDLGLTWNRSGPLPSQGGVYAAIWVSGPGIAAPFLLGALYDGSGGASAIISYDGIAWSEDDTDIGADRWLGAAYAPDKRKLLLLGFGDSFAAANTIVGDVY